VKKIKPQSNYELEALEPRILLSADAAEVLTPGVAEVAEVVLQNQNAEPSPLQGDLSFSGENLYPTTNDYVSDNIGETDADPEPLRADRGFSGSLGNTNLSADITTESVPIIFDTNVNLVDNGTNSILLDTTDGIGNEAGANIFIAGTVSGTGINGGGVLVLDAGTGGDILIEGDVGTTDPLNGIEILNARNVFFNGNVLLNSFTQVAGTGNTTFGDAASDTVEIGTGNLTLLTENNITFSGDVEVTNGDMDLTVNTASVGTAKIHFKGNTDLLDGDVIIRTAKNVEFTGLLNINGNLSQLVGSQVTIFRDDVGADSVSISADQEIRFLGEVRLEVGDLILTSNDVNFNGGSSSIIGAQDITNLPQSNVLLRPVTESVSMDVGSPVGGVGTFQFTTTDIAALADGFTSITFGYDTASTNNLRLGNAIFTDPLTVYGGTFLVVGTLNAKASLLLDATVGGIEVTGAQIQIGNDQVDSVWQSSVLSLTAHQGDIDFTNGGSLRILNNSDVDLTQGSNIFLTATTGSIINEAGSSGFITSRDLTASASGAITLLTEITNFTGTSTTSGDITVDELDDLRVISALTADGSIAMSTGGDTIVDLFQSQTDSSGNDISMQVFNGDLDIGQVLAGNLGDVSLEVEGALTGFNPQVLPHVVGNKLTFIVHDGIGQGSVPLLINANIVNATNTDNGAVVIDQITGRTDLSASIINDATGAADHIHLNVVGNVTINSAGMKSASDAGIGLHATGTVTFDVNVIGEGGLLSVSADSNIQLNAGVVLNSGGGNISIFTENGTFTQAVDAEVVSEGGQIIVAAFDDVILGIVDARNLLTPADQETWGNVLLASQDGSISDYLGISVINVFANELSVFARTGIGALNGLTELGLEIDARTLAAITTTGAIAVKDVNDLTTGATSSLELGFLNADGTFLLLGPSDPTYGVLNSNGDILISAEGLLTATTANAIVSDGAGTVALIADSMSIEGIIQSAGGNLSLSSVNDISLLDAGDLLTSGAGDIAVSSSAGSILAEAGQSMFTGMGTILGSAFNAVVLGTIETTGAVGLRASTDNLLAANGGTDTRTVVIADTMAIDAFGVNGPTTSSEAFRTEVNTLSLVGGTGPEFQIHNDGDLIIDTTSATVDLYTALLATSALLIAPQNDVDVSGEGNIGIEFDGGDGIVATGRIIRTTGAGNIVLNASGAFTMGTGAQISNENGTITIDAVNTVSVSEVDSIDGDITVTSTTGAIIDSDPAEAAVDFSTLGQLALDAATGIGIEASQRQTLNVLLGTLSAETASGGIFVTSTAGFATNGLLSTAGTTSISVTSGGDLIVGPNLSGVAVDAAGDLVLLADGNLTQLANSTIDAGADIRLSAGATMTLVEVSTPGDVALSAFSVSGLPATTETELTANGLYLDNVGTLGTAAQPLRMEISRLSGTVNTGTLAFENTGDLALGLVTVETTPTVPMGALPGLTFIQTGDRLLVDGSGEGVFAAITGSLIVDAGIGLALTVSEAIPVLWETTTFQTWNDAFSLAGGDLTLRTGDDLTFTAGGTSATNNGNVSLDVEGNLSFSTTSGIDAGTGSQLAQVAGSVLLNGELISSASIGILAGTTITNTAIGGPVVRIVAADLLLSAGVQIAAGLFPVTTNVDRLSAISGAGGVYVSNQGDLLVTNLGFSVPSLNADSTVNTAFSGHQGGVSTDQAGAISLTTSGTLTVQEVSAVIEAFPATANALSIVADAAGPDANTLNILFDIIESSSGGDPVTTVYTTETGLLTVTLRKDVSTLQEIIDAINADVDFAATAVLAEGPQDGSQIFTLATSEDFAFFAEGGRREGVLVGVSGTLEGGLEPISATSQILLPGASYNLLFTALSPGDAANSFEVRLLDDGPSGNLTDAADEALIDWDEPNGNLNIFINFGVTTIGTVVTAVSNAQTNDGVPFSVALDGFSVPSDLNNILGDSSVTLQSNLSASAELRPIGINNDIEIVATTSGQLYNQIDTVIVDDGSVATLGVRSNFDIIENVLTVYIQSGTTTASDVLTAINTEGTFSASLLQENTGGTNTGAGVLQANIFELHSGAVGVNAFANLLMSGSNNDISLTADIPGADENGIQILLIADSNLPIGSATATYNGTSRVLEVRLNSAFSTAGNVIDAINTAAIGVLTATSVGSGAGGVELADYPETAGGTGGPPEAIFVATGFNNDFELVADSNSPLLENIEVFLIDDGSITDGSATAVYLSGPRHLVLNVQSGVTTLNDLLLVLNADAAIPVSGTLLADNDGSGTFNIPTQDFTGGADPVKAQAPTTLPSGTEIILEADDGGVAQNDIQVVYAFNPSLIPGSAAASFFEVEGVRLLQIQVQNSSVTFNTIDQALTLAGLPFSIANLGAIGTQEVGLLALRAVGVQEGSLRLNSGDDISLVGRVQSQTGPVTITTGNGGNLTFDSETARIYAISSAEITLDGSFANLSSTESPLVKVFGEGLLSILTEENTLESEFPVRLQSAGDITLSGTGGMSLNDQNLDVESGGDITVNAPVTAGTGNITLDAEGGITVTVDGPLVGEDLLLTAVDDILQDGNLTATGTGTVTVTTTTGAITMGAASVTSSDTGNIAYTADGNVGITTISSISGNIDVISGAAITDTHATNGNNLATGGVTTLTAQTGIGAVGTGELKTQVGDLQLRNLGASGDIVITEEPAGGDLTITELTQDGVLGWSIITIDNGNLTLSGPVTHSDAGSLVIGVNGNLLAQDEINLEGGTLSSGVTGNATFNANVNTNGGDAGVEAGGFISMDPTMTLDADGGNVLVQAVQNVLVSHVLSPNADVRIESTTASVLRAVNDGSTNVTAGTLQLEAATSVGSLGAANEALITEVTRLNASAHGGDLAVNETDALLIGNSSVTVNFAQINKSIISNTFNESQLMTQTGSAVLQVGGALTVEVSDTDPSIAIDGNFYLSTGDVLTLNGDSEVTSGSAQLVSTLGTFLNGDLDVFDGTLLMQSGGVFTQDPAAVITVADHNAVVNAVGIMTLSRVDTGTGDLSLMSDVDILVDASAPAVQLTSSGLRLESGGAIGSVANPVNLTADTLSALALNGIHLDVTGDVDVNTVGVTVDTVNPLGATTDAAFVKADLSDIESTSEGNILMQVSGALELNDGDTDEIAVTTTGTGKIFLGANTLNAYANVNSVDGSISLVIAAAANWITTPESAPAAGDGLAAKILSVNGDLNIVVGAALTMADQTIFRSVDGNIYLQTTADLLAGSIQAANGLVALNVGGTLLDNGPSDTDVIADELQIVTGTGIGILSPYEALDIDANLLSAQVTTGPMVLSELTAVDVGEVAGSVMVLDVAGVMSTTTVAPLYGLQSLGGDSVSMTAVDNVTILTGGDPTDTEHGISLTGTGNLFLRSSAGTLTVNDSIMGGTGHLTLRGNTGMTIAAGVPVVTSGTGTLTLLSETGFITQAAGSSLNASNGDIVLQAAGTISLAEITTSVQVSVRSTNGAILDNNGTSLNITGSSLRLDAGLNIATGLDPLETNVGTLSARTTNGAMYLNEANNLDIGSTEASSQVVLADGSVTATPVAALTGLTTGGAAGTIVVATPAGELNVLTGNVVSASQAGNILLTSQNALDIDAAISSGSGTITLETSSLLANIDLAEVIEVTTGGAGQIQVLSNGAIITGAESRFVAGTGNVVVAAAGEVILGGISTSGRAVVGSASGSILGAGSTTFDFEVIASQLALIAAFGGVGSLSPSALVQPFRTSVARIAGSAGYVGMNLVNDISVSVDEVIVVPQRVNLSGSLEGFTTFVLQDLTTGSGNGSIVLRSTTGSVSLNEGGDTDDLSVTAHGSGNIRIYAAQNITANSDVRSGTGHLTLRANGSLSINGDVTTANPGTVYLRAETGALIMAGTSTLTATNSGIVLRGSNDVTLGNLLAENASVTSVNGSIINGTGSTTNFTGNGLRLESSTDIGSSLAPLTTGAAVLSAVSNGGSIYILEADDITVGTVGFSVQEVLNDASTSPVIETPLTGLTTTANNGDILLVSSAGSIIVDQEVSANGSGNILLEGANTITLDVDVASTTGNLTVIAGSGLSLAANVDLTTTGAGSVYVDAGTGGISMNATATASAGAALRFAADGDLSLSSLTATNASIISRTGDILKVVGPSINITATGLRLTADGTIGVPANHLRIAAGTLSASAETGDIFLTESDNVTITAVTVTTTIVAADGSTSSVVDAEQSDLRTGDNGDIVLVALAGSITLNDGGDEDFLAVEADGTGSIRLDASINLAVNSGISSTSGDITLVAGGNISAGIGVVVVSTTNPGTISLRATSGAVTMTGLTQLTALNSSLRVSGSGDVTLGTLIADDVSILSMAGSVVNATGTIRNVTATKLRINAATGVGTAFRHITTAVGTMSGRAGSGGIFISELDALTIGEVAVTVNEFTPTAGSTILTDAALSDLRATASGDVLLVTGDTLSLGTVAGDIVNLFSSGAIVNNAVSTPNVEATSLLLNAQDSIGSVTVPLTTDVDILSVTSIDGDIFISDSGNVEVGSVDNLSTPSNPSDQQSNVVTDTANTVVLAAVGNLTLGRITSGTVALFAGNQVLKTVASTLNVDATALRIQAVNGVGALGNYLVTRVDTLAGASTTGDILISDNEGLLIGSVTITGLLSDVETLSGVNIATSGDLVILSDDALTVQQPISVVQNVRLSADSVLDLGTITANTISLLSDAAIVHTSGLITADQLRVNGAGNVGSLTRGLHTQVNRLSVVSTSPTGTLFLVEADNAELGSVSLTAGGVTDQAQHGVGATGPINLISLAGRFLDGGDAEADIRSDSLVTITSVTGLGTTGTGALDIAVADLFISSTGNGNLYLNLLNTTDVNGVTITGHGSLYLDVAGDLTLSGTATVSATGAAFIDVTGSTDLQASLTAGRDIRISSNTLNQADAVSVVSTTGNVRVRTFTDLVMGLGSLIEATTGSVRIQSGSDFTVGLIVGQNVTLHAVGTMSAASTDRSTHQVTGDAVRLTADGAILPLLTDADRIDINAGALSEIYELDDLIIGRYGLRLISEVTGDRLTLRMNQAELSSYDGVAVVPGVGTFVWTSTENLTLATRLVTDNGSIIITAENLQQTGTLIGAYVDAGNGRVTLNLEDGAGTTDTNPITIDADELTANSQTGEQVYQVDGSVILSADGITTTSGSGGIQLVVDNGNLTQSGRIIHSGNGTIHLDIPDGLLDVQADGIADADTIALYKSGGTIQLELDTGISLTGVARLLLNGSSFAATSRTGNMKLELLASDGTQSLLQNVLIQEGTGTLDIFSSQALVIFGSVRNLANGNLSIRSGTFISMALGSLVRSETGALSLHAQELELTRVESFGSSTLLKSTIFGIKIKPGQGGIHLAGDHTARLEINTDIVGFTVGTPVNVFDVNTGTLLTSFTAGTTINYTAP